MNFDFSDDQREIKRTARDLLAQRSSLEAVREAAERRAYDDALWSELSELGWPGIAVGEAYGGSGLGVVELALLCEELGYAITPSPFLSTTRAATFVEAAAAPDVRERWLPGLASGELRGTVGHGMPGEPVPDATRADVLVLLDRDGGGRVVAATDATIEAVATIDPTRDYGRVTANASAGSPLAADLGAAADRAAVLVAAELVGVAQRAMEMAIEYAKERKQFGVPVGSFQAVQHRCAQMLLQTESARSAAYYAAWAADAQPELLAEAGAIARVAALDAGRDVTASAIQVHGGIGFTWEADVHWLFKRAQLDARMLGGGGRARLAGILRDRVARAA